MNRRVLCLAVLVGAVLVGCGGTQAEPEGEPLGSVSGALVTCTAACEDGPSVSCTGNTCSATNNSGVTCDGVTTACAPSECVGVACEDLSGQFCAPRERVECCAPNGRQSICSCIQGRLLCIY